MVWIVQVAVGWNSRVLNTTMQRNLAGATITYLTIATVTRRTRAAGVVAVPAGTVNAHVEAVAGVLLLAHKCKEAVKWCCSS